MCESLANKGRLKIHISLEGIGRLVGGINYH